MMYLPVVYSSKPNSFQSCKIFFFYLRPTTVIHFKPLHACNNVLIVTNRIKRIICLNILYNTSNNKLIDKVHFNNGSHVRFP